MSSLQRTDIRMLKHGPTCHLDGIRGYGDPSFKLMRIGIAPGEDEVAKGRPFTGPTGQLLNSITSAVGYDPTHTYDTNAICTWHNEPTIDQLEACKERLLDEIEVYQPKLIVFLGADVPGRYYLGKQAKRGWVYDFHARSFTTKALYTYHPSAVLRGSNHLIYDIVRDLQKIPLWLDSNWPPTFNGYTLIDNPKDAQDALDSFVAGSEVALDIETRLHDPNVDELDIYTDNLICLSVSDGKSTFVFTRTACGDIEHPLHWPTNVLWGYHNSPFDRAGLLKYLGIDLPVSWDTMYESSGRDEYTGTTKFKRAGQNKLETLTAEYFGDITYKDATKKSWRKHIEPEPHELHLRNAKDAFYTQQLHPILMGFEPHDAYRSLVLPASDVYSRVMAYGAHIDKRAMGALASEWAPIYNRIYMSLVKVGVLNPNSTKQLSTYLYDELGLYGGPSTAKDVLREIDHPVAASILEMRNLWYLMTHWIFSLQDFIKPDGRVHPNIILHGPETGRRAAHDPPIQTIPKHGERLSKIRTLFAASSPQYVIAEADYSQAEMWYAAYISQDDAMLRDLSTTPEGWSKPDVHLATAHRTGIVELLPYDLARQAGKTLNFLMLYGGAAQKFQQTLAFRGINLPFDTCSQIVNEYRQAYHKFNEWAERTWRLALDQGYIESPWGRKRRFPLILDPSWRSQVINWPIQSGAGDYTLDSVIKLYPRLLPLDCHILFDIHDSICFELNRANLEEATSIIHKVMQEDKVLGPIHIDFKYGEHL